MGQSPPAFDILAWNADSTRPPAAMHSFYLRSLYLRNELARGELTLAGQRLYLKPVGQGTYRVVLPTVVVAQDRVSQIRSSGWIILPPAGT